jgi:hypothetical protein
MSKQEGEQFISPLEFKVAKAVEDLSDGADVGALVKLINAVTMMDAIQGPDETNKAIAKSIRDAVDCARERIATKKSV